MLRDGESNSINPREVLVGDVVKLEQGMIFPADGLIISCANLEVSEAALTGENDNINKHTFEDCWSQY